MVTILDNKITPSSMLHDSVSFPFGDKRYIVSGFFHLYLANKYGDDKGFKFFGEHSKKWFFPFDFDDAFIQTYGIDFNTALSDFVRHYKQKGKNFNFVEFDESKIKTVFSLRNTRMSYQNNEIKFLVGDGYNYNEMIKYNTKTKHFSKEVSHLSNGEIFTINGIDYSASSTKINPEVLKIALVDENGNIAKNTMNKMITDIHGSKMAYFDMNNNYIAHKLYIDGVFYDELSSSALFDEQGKHILF